MKPEQLQAIRERCDKATPGPWEWRKGTHSDIGYIDSPQWKVCDFGRGRDWDQHHGTEPEEHDMDFIINAHTDISALLTDNEQLRGALEYIQRHRMIVGEMAYIVARNALGNEGKSYAQIYGGQEDPTVALIREHRARRALEGDS